MNVRLVSLFCGVLTLLLCASVAHAYEITDTVAKARLLKRLDARYYNLRDRRFVVADCDVRSSIMDDIDTMLSALGSGRNPALKAFRVMKTSLHFELLVPATVNTTGSVRTDDEKLDSLVAYMLSWSNNYLVHAINSWKIFTTAFSQSSRSASQSDSRVFHEERGYRIQGILSTGDTMEVLIDSALRVTEMKRAVRGIPISMIPQFRDTPHGLVLSQLDMTIPSLKARYAFTIKHKEVKGILLPSSLTLSADNPSAPPGGMAMGTMDLTITLSNYRIIKG